MFTVHSEEPSRLVPHLEAQLVVGKQSFFFKACLICNEEKENYDNSLLLFVRLRFYLTIVCVAQRRVNDLDEWVS